MDGLLATSLAILEWAQRFGLVGAAASFMIGGFTLMLGGDRGRPKAIGWFIGAAVGLVIVMGAYGLAEGIDSNIKF